MVSKENRKDRGGHGQVESTTFTWPGCTLTTHSRLNIEIERFYNYTKPGRFESVARKHVIEQVREHVRRSLAGYVVEVFGSERTGIALATSDIDFRLMRQSRMADLATAKLPPTAEQRTDGLRALHKLLYSTIKKKRDIYLLPALRHARYPLISAQDRDSALDIQIVLSNDTSDSRVIMERYMEEYPYLRQLHYVVKTMFDVRGLSDVFRGGFGSYSLFMMVVASLKHAPHPRGDAAGGLKNFLRFWRDFDTRKQGVSIEPAFLFDKTKTHIRTDTVRAKLEVYTSSVAYVQLLTCTREAQPSPSQSTCSPSATPLTKRTISAAKA
jgi:non-canonical poly(A) RNA polymerase PAPD5/7